MTDYFISPEADQDLDHLYQEGVERFGIFQADAYLDGLFDKFVLLSQFSSLGEGLKLKSKPFRRYPYKAHIVLFEPVKGGVKILRIFHGSSNYMRHLEEDS